MPVLPRKMSSPGASSSVRPTYRRSRYYVDRSVQRTLLVAMVVLEIVLVATAIGYAYWRLTQLIDANMYRMAFSQTGPTLMMQFSKEGFWILGLFAVVNVIALMVAARIWSRHENLVLRDFCKLTEKSRQLDFSEDAETPRKHKALGLAAAWRTRERARFIAIREQVTELETALSLGASVQEMQIPLENLGRLLH